MHGAKEFLTAEGSKRPQSVHNSGSYWRVMRAAATALKWSSGALLDLIWLDSKPGYD